MAARLKIEKITVMHEKTRLAVPVWTLDSGKPGPRFLVLAAQHGNEVQGSEAIRRFIAWARTRIVAGRIAAIPFANLPAIRGRRPHFGMGPEQAYADDRGHNMNRTWSGGFNNSTARLAAAIYDAYGADATHVLDIHCWEQSAAPGVITRDEPRLRALAENLGARFVNLAQPSPHTIGGRFNSGGRVGITYECSGQYMVCEEQVQACLAVIVNMAKAIGVARGEPQPVQPVIFLSEAETTRVLAPQPGLFVRGKFRHGDKVRKGAVLGHILSDDDLSWNAVAAPVSGYLRQCGAARAGADVALPGRHPYVAEGERLATICRQAD